MLRKPAANFMSELNTFEPFPKMPRLNREIIITEKIDGTNAQIYIHDDGVTMQVGSRNRWITPADDNYGFAGWCERNREELLKLGPGRHFGEWWGAGIQRRYSLSEKRFSLFNVSRWTYDAEARTVDEWGRDIIHRPGVVERADILGPKGPNCCHLVPIVYQGPFSYLEINHALSRLRDGGSYAAPGFMQPEGIVVFHTAAKQCFKVTLENDESPKGLVKTRR